MRLMSSSGHERAMHNTLALFERLQAFDIDSDRPRLTFVARLARENGWTPDFAARVVDEYKRFIALAATAPHPVTPSEHIDQAWHLHLAYTDSYWTRMCGQVVGRPINHNPTRGGDTENRKFDDWYARTLETYRQAFGHAPPTEIWPSPEQRFGKDLAWQRVNTRENWILPRRAVLHAVIGASACIGVVFGAIGLTLAALRSSSPSAGLLLIIGALGAVPGLVLGCRWAKRRRTSRVRASLACALVGASFAGGVMLLTLLIAPNRMPEDTFTVLAVIVTGLLICGIVVLAPTATARSIAAQAPPRETQVDAAASSPLAAETMPVAVGAAAVVEAVAEDVGDRHHARVPWPRLRAPHSRVDQLRESQPKHRYSSYTAVAPDARSSHESAAHGNGAPSISISTITNSGWIALPPHQNQCRFSG